MAKPVIAVLSLIVDISRKIRRELTAIYRDWENQNSFAKP